ncbi:hypothetical protein [Nocardioides exalbidus]|uniref:hypothetical protein n=1 Tax=Nocardioides exalbidus TaxID=402596 RepID=UPI000B8974DE|nr:hypothetical protein [Nocardioides exalbidus]
MRKPWLDWSRRRFLWTMLLAVGILFGIRWALAKVIDSSAADALLLVVYLAAGLAVLYLTFSWTREHDRRNPRQ